LGLEGDPPHYSIQMMDDISFHEKLRKEGPLEEDDILVQRKDGFENGFHKNGCVAKVVKNTRI